MGTHAVRGIASAVAVWLLASVGAAAQGPAPARAALGVPRRPEPLNTVLPRGRRYS